MTIFERYGFGLFLITISAFPGETVENHKKSQSGSPASEPESVRLIAKDSYEI
jgi:hypothetical protein